MSINNTIKDFEEKLSEIEAKIDYCADHVNNKMPAQNLMIFFLLGGKDATKELLKRKVSNLLRNPNACVFINIDKDEAVDGSTYSEIIENTVLESARNHADVENLNTVFLCPVVFSDNYSSENVGVFISQIGTYMAMSGRTSIWQPFLIISKKIDQYKNIYMNINLIRSFLKKKTTEIVNRCCLISDTDDKGFIVPVENIMQTIAMTAVLQNVISDNPEAAHTINSKVRIDPNRLDGDDVFYTSRNAPISNPKRSFIIQNMLVALKYFSGDTDASSSNVLERMDFSFVNDIIQKQLNDLPHNRDCITLYPLFSVMNCGDFHNSLKSVIEQYYIFPLYDESKRKKLIAEAQEKFLSVFFYNNGSLKNLQKILASGEITEKLSRTDTTCYKDIPIDTIPCGNKKLQLFYEGEYCKAAAYCEKGIKSAASKLLEDLGKSLTADAVSAVDETLNAMDSMENSIKERLRLLKDIETLLVVNQTESKTDFFDIQSSWFEGHVSKNEKHLAQLNKKFDELIFNLMTNPDTDMSCLLDVCYEAVKTSAFTDMGYMKKLSEECARSKNKSEEFTEIVEKGWGYTLRFISRDAVNDVTCIIGDSCNMFYSALQKHFNGTQFNFPDFDRIDVLHISSPFAASALKEWQYIESVGKGKNEC